MVKRVRKILVPIFLLCEVGVFCGLYLFGDKGMSVLQDVIQSNNDFKCEIEQLKAELKELEDDARIWRKHDFYKEKIAREQLQMARDGETIYYIDSY